MTRALHKDREMPNLSPTNSNFLDKIDSDSDKSPDEDQMEDLGPPLENDAFDPIFNRANSYGRDMASVDMKQKDSIDDFNINSPETPREEEEPKMASLYESYMNKQKESLQPSDSEKPKSQEPIDVEMEDDEKPGKLNSVTVAPWCYFLERLKLVKSVVSNSTVIMYRIIKTLAIRVQQCSY